MSGVQRIQQDMDQQNQDKESDSKSAEIETKQDIPDMQTSQQPLSQPARQRAFRFVCCCCCCRSPSPEPGDPVNKDSASCPQAHTSGAQSVTAEPAETSKDPSSEKDQLTTEYLLHRLFSSTEEHHTRYHNKHRSEHVKDGVLNGCTHGRASRPRSSQDILESENKMKHSRSKTNIKEVIDSEQPTGSEALHSFQECTSTVPHISTCDTHSSESKEEEEEVADDAASGTAQATNEESDLTTNPMTESQSSLASPRPSHSAQDLQSLNSQLSPATFSGRKPGDGCSSTSPLEQTTQPHVATVPSYSERSKKVTNSEPPTGSETLHSFQECTGTVPHLSTSDTQSSESKEEEEEVADDAASGTVQATSEESDLTTDPMTESQSSLASPRPSHSAQDLQSLNSQLSPATFSGRKPGDGERPTSSETLHSFQECTSTVPHLSTSDTQSREPKEEEADDAASGTVQAKNTESDMITILTIDSLSILASSISSHSARDLQSPNSQINTATFSGGKPDDGCSPTSPLEQTSQPHVALTPTYTERHRTTDPLQSVDEASGATSSGWPEDLNVDDTLTSTDIELLLHMQGCGGEQEGSSVDEDTTSEKDSETETTCNPSPPHNPRFSSVVEPGAPSQASSDRTDFYRRQHPPVGREQDAGHERGRTADKLKSANEAQGQRSSRGLANLNVNNTIMLSHIKKLEHVQECQEEQGGVTSAENTKSVEDSKKETVCRQLPPCKWGYSPYILQNAPNFLRWQARRHPRVGRKQDAVRERTTTTDRVSADEEASGSCLSRQRHNLNVESSIASSNGDGEELVHVQERQEAASARNTQSVEDSSKETELRPFSPHSAKRVLKPCSARQRDNLHRDDRLSCIKKQEHKQECEKILSGATTDENIKSEEDSSKEAARRPPTHYNPRLTRVFEPRAFWAQQHHPASNDQPSQASSARTDLYQGQHPSVEREQDAVKRRTRTTKTSEARDKSSGARWTTDPLESDEEAAGPCSARQRDNLHRDDRLSYFKKQARKQECEEIQSGATTDENIESEEDSSKESARRPPTHYNPRLTRVFEPRAFWARQHHPASNDQPNQASSARTDLYQGQSPQVEREQDTVQGGTRTTDSLLSADDTSLGASSSRWRFNLKEFEEKQKKAAAAAKKSQTVCRPPLPPYNQRFARVIPINNQQTRQNRPAFQRLQNDQPNQASSARTDLYQGQHPPVERERPPVEREQDVVRRRTRTTKTSEACDKSSGASSSRRRDNMNVDDTMMSSGIAEQAHRQKREGAQSEATAAENKKSVEFSSKRSSCRLKLSLSSMSSNEEEDQCRICHSSKKSQANPLLSPCRCSGSLQFVHLECLKTWIRIKMRTRSPPHQAQICELCRGQLTVDPAIFDLEAYCRQYYPQMIIWQFDERRMRFLGRAVRRGPPP